MYYAKRVLKKNDPFVIYFKNGTGNLHPLYSVEEEEDRSRTYLLFFAGILL